MDSPVSQNPVSQDLLAQLLIQAVNQTQDGIAIADAQRPGYPLIYVNRGFEKLTGYTAAEVVGKDYGLLQGRDAEQPELAIIREAVNKAQPCVVTMRNYRKNGSMFWNELSISPVHDHEQHLTHFIVIQKDVSSKVLLDQHIQQSHDNLHKINQQLSHMVYNDQLVGLSNKRRFDEQFNTLRAVAQRAHSEVSVLMIDIDHFRQFNERYGRAAGDECLRMVGECIAKSFARSSDCAARFSGEEFAVATLAANRGELARHAQKLREQVRALNIPNSDSPHGVVTISIGGIHRRVDWQNQDEDFIALAERELHAAKKNGRDCVYLAE